MERGAERAPGKMPVALALRREHRAAFAADLWGRYGVRLEQRDSWQPEAVEAYAQALLGDLTSRTYAALHEWPLTLPDWLSLHTYAASWRAAAVLQSIAPVELDAVPMPWDKPDEPEPEDPEVVAEAEDILRRYSALRNPGEVT